MSRHGAPYTARTSIIHAQQRRERLGVGLRWRGKAELNIYKRSKSNAESHRSSHRAEGSLGSQAALEGNTETPGLPEDSARCVALLNQAVGDEGLEQTQQFPRKSNNGPVRDAEYDARCADSGAIDPDLEGLIRAWPNLSESVRKEILKYLPLPESS